MQLAAWLDVALEGGVRELERARADYRSLRKLLRGDWRADARQVLALAEDLRRAHRNVNEAIERADRRARVDSSAKAGAELARLVENERAGVLLLLNTARGESAGWNSQLDWLCETAKEECFFVSSRVLLCRERNVWTGFFLTLSAAIPFGAWFVASHGGTTHTILSVEGLEEPVLVCSFAVVLLALIVSWVRLMNWAWLGVQVPRLLEPAVISGAVGVLAAIAVIAFGLRTPVPLAFALFVSASVAVREVLVAFWKIPRPPQSMA